MRSILISFRRQDKVSIAFAGALSASSLILLMAALPVYSAEDSPVGFLRLDPERVVGAKACGECHAAEYEVWKGTSHATGIKTQHGEETKPLHRRVSATDKAKKMGLPLIKRDSLCIRCHYTPKYEEGQLRARLGIEAGVSCESCHGAGRDWINIHSKYLGRGIADLSEDEEKDRRKIIAKSVEEGMRRPSLLYDVAKSCYGCHIVPEEELVNIGGHKTGSSDFELVKRSQGEIRHNYVAAQRGGSSENIQRSAERKRVMYVVGRAVELEMVLRGVAAATTGGRYLNSMVRRAGQALGEVIEIREKAKLELPEMSDEMNKMIAIVRELDGVSLENAADLIRAADQIGKITEEIPNRYDGTKLTMLDPLVRGSVEVAPAEIEDELDDTVTEEESAVPVKAETQASGSGDDCEAAEDVELIPTSTGGRPVVGERKTSLRRRPPSASHDTIAECIDCHASQYEWWSEDDHYRAARPFLSRTREKRNVDIASLYGIQAKDMARGNELCMDCHGTVVSSRKSSLVREGVGCQSCHGGAADYIESHQLGDKARGEDRRGYQEALKAGMVELRDLDERALTCTGCHYITDRRLLSSGHPSGEGFDYAGNMSRVQHWEHALAPAEELKKAFSNALGDRDPVPNVPIGQLPTITSPAPRSGSGRGGPCAAPTATASSSARQPDRGSRVGGGVFDREPEPSAPLGLPDFPEIDSSSAIEKVLQKVKDHLDQLHDAVYPP